MGDLATYDLINFFPFSRAVLVRLYERLLEEWPIVAAVAVLLTLAWVVCVASGRGRVAAILSGAAAAGTGYFYFFAEYASLNWAGEYAAYAFGAQAVGLVAFGVADPVERGASPALSGAIAGFVVLVSPAVWAVTGEDWPVLELMGLTPDVTAVAILVFLASVRGAASNRFIIRGVLAVVPTLWLAVSVLTWVAMDDPTGFIVPVAGLASAVALFVAQIAQGGRGT